MPDNKAVDAVGTFTDFVAHLDPTSTQVGQGMTLTLALTGDTDFEGLTGFQLRNIPSWLKWYESKTNVQHSSDGTQTKVFEYVLQPMQAESAEIPSQVFSYFDTTSKSYKKLATSPIAFTIKPSRAVVAKEKKEPSEIKEEKKKNKSNIRPVAENTFNQARKIPWSVFFFLLAVIVVLGLSITFKDQLVRFRSPQNSSADYKKIFAHTRAAIKRARNNADYSALYPLFIHLVAVRTGKASNTINNAYIQALLLERGVGPQLLQKWQTFFADISALVFAPGSVEKNDQLFAQALEWNDILQEIL